MCEMSYSRVDVQDRYKPVYILFRRRHKTALTLDSRRGAVLSTVCHVAPPQYVHEAR